MNCRVIHSAVPIFLVTVSCCFLSSCSSSESQSMAVEAPITFPTDFEDDGTKWTKSNSVSEADLTVLSGYFKRNSSLAEGPLISGDPTLYTSPKGTRRFYWGRSGDKASEWIYIQFMGRKATVQEGTGSPLDSPST